MDQEHTVQELQNSLRSYLSLFQAGKKEGIRKDYLLSFDSVPFKVLFQAEKNLLDDGVPYYPLKGLIQLLYPSSAAPAASCTGSCLEEP
ncbi:MAG: hypothetical protein LKE52_00165 [Bacilli bacterium]|jgi:hypothetical protein|nr:hypothetical protein [Bacilli bacterium]